MGSAQFKQQESGLGNSHSVSVVRIPLVEGVGGQAGRRSYIWQLAKFDQGRRGAKDDQRDLRMANGVVGPWRHHIPFYCRSSRGSTLEGEQLGGGLKLAVCQR